MTSMHRAAAIIGTVWYQAKLDASRDKPRLGWTVGDAIAGAYGSKAHLQIMALVMSAYERGKRDGAKR